MAQDTNPYLMTGFVDGFGQGLNLVLKMKDRETARQERERRWAMEDTQAEREGVRFEREGVQFEQQQEEAQYRKEKLRPLQEEQAKLGIKATKQEMRKRGIEIETAELGLQTEKDRRKAIDLSLKTEKVFSMGQHVADLIENDPQWVQDGEVAFAFAQGDPSITSDPQKYKQALDWFQKSYEPQINAGIGDEIDPKTAKQQGVPKGSVIKRKRIKNFFIEGEDAVIALEVIVTDKDGVDHAYDAPLTMDRSSAPDAEVLMVPITELEKLSQAAGMFSSAVEQAGMEGATPSDVSIFIRQSLQQSARDLKPSERYRVVGKNLVDVTTNPPTPIYSEEDSGISPSRVLTTMVQVHTDLMTRSRDGKVDMDEVKKRAMLLVQSAEGKAPVVPAKERLSLKELQQKIREEGLSKEDAFALALENDLIDPKTGKLKE